MENSNLKPIETVYNGFRFRSRLEARWAVFMSALGVEYDYEAEGYDLGDGIYYLPDFYLPQLNCFLEIKAVSPSQEEETKASLLADQSGKAVFISSGSIPREFPWDHPEGLLIQYYMGGPGYDYLYYWCECEFCGEIGIQFDGRSERISCCPDNSMVGKRYTGASARLIAAYRAASTARFEHGENG